MAKRKSSSTKKSVISLSGIAFFAIMLIGLSLLAAFILGKIDSDLSSVARTIERIGFALAILVTAILSYNWARRSKQWVFVLWIIAIILVIVFYVLNVFF